jgi:hypothetical protein
MRKLVGWVGLVLLFLAADARSASAGCVATFRDCVQIARSHNKFWDRFWAAFDCELDLAGCIKDKLIG